MYTFWYVYRQEYEYVYKQTLYMYIYTHTTSRHAKNMCMHVDRHRWTCVYVHKYMNISMTTCMYVYVYMLYGCMHDSMSADVHESICICINEWHLSLYACSRQTYICMYVHTYKYYIYAYIHICVCMYTYNSVGM